MLFHYQIEEGLLYYEKRLEPLDILQMKQECFGMAFIAKFPLTRQGYDDVLTIIVYLSKVAHSMLKKESSAMGTTKITVK